MSSAKVVVIKREKDETYQNTVISALKKIDLKNTIHETDRILIDLNLLLDEDYMLGNIRSV